MVLVIDDEEDSRSLYEYILLSITFRETQKMTSLKSARPMNLMKDAIQHVSSAMRSI